MLNLDTHIFLFALLNQLTREERAVLSRSRWGLSSIVLWEIAMLYSRGRITLSLDTPAVSERLEEVHIWPISKDIAVKACSLDFSSDPADELIAATSVVHDVPLMTRDIKILRSRMVPFA